MKQKQYNALSIINLLVRSNPKLPGGELRGLGDEIKFPKSAIKKFNISLSGLTEWLSPELIRSKKSFIYLSFCRDPMPQLKALRSFLEVLYDYDEKFQTKFNYYSQFSFFRNTIIYDECEFINRVKYLTVFPYAHFTQNDYEESDLDNPWFFTGRLKSYLKARMRGKYSSKVARLWWSWLQGVKRACELPDDDFEQKAYEKHRVSLDVDPPTIDGFYAERFKRKVDRITSGFKAEEKLYQISSSACFENSKGGGGGLAYILWQQNAFIDRKIPLTTNYSLLRMVEWKCKVTCVYGLVQPSLPELYNLMDYFSHSDVRVQAVREPLKVRMVTKGCAYTYWYSRFFQKAMWSHISKMIPFELIGRPIDQDVIYRLLERGKRFFPKQMQFASVDYKAATDNLNIGLTKIVMESFLSRCDNIDSTRKDMLRSIIYEQNVTYPTKSGVEDLTQRNGQLMGSTLSFPILCIVNLVSFWMAFESYTMKIIKLEDLPVLVNGDDMLFSTDESLYPHWLYHLSTTGFKLSVGKNYLHKSLFTMNSELFKCVEGRVISIPYFNTGLLTGQAKLGSSDKIVSLRDSYNMVIDGAQNKLRAHHRFIYYNKARIPAMKENLFIDSLYGGLGFNLCDEVKPFVKVTDLQLRMIKTVKRLTHQGNLPTYGYISNSCSNSVKKDHFKNDRIGREMDVLRENEFISELDIERIDNSSWITSSPEIHYVPFPLKLVQTGVSKTAEPFTKVKRISFSTLVPDSVSFCSADVLV